MQTYDRPKLYTPEEYLALEDVADFKSEYIDGAIVPRLDGTTNHNRILMYIEQLVRLDKKHWSLRVYDEEDTTVEFSSIPTQISLTDIYNKVKFAPTANLEETGEGAIEQPEHS
jgi:hypothetical protein